MLPHIYSLLRHATHYGNGIPYLLTHQCNSEFPQTGESKPKARLLHIQCIHSPGAASFCHVQILQSTCYCIEIRGLGMTLRRYSNPWGLEPGYILTHGMGTGAWE